MSFNKRVITPSSILDRYINFGMNGIISYLEVDAFIIKDDPDEWCGNIVELYFNEDYDIIENMIKKKMREH